MALALRLIRNPMSWGATLSIAFLGLFVAYLDTEGLSALEPNELGDTLAGLAGGLAFIWIVVAVFMQKAELEAQREELTLTRLEHEAARKVLSQQADGLAEQVKLLASERQSREANQAKSDLDELCGALLAECRRDSNRFVRYRVGTNPPDHIEIFNDRRLADAKDKIEAVSLIYEGIFRAVREVAAHRERGLKVQIFQLPKFVKHEEFSDGVRASLAEIAPMLDAGGRLRLGASNLDFLLNNIDALREMAKVDEHD